MKKLWLLLPALILAAGLVFMGCDVPEDDNDTSGDVTWTVSADGAGVAGVGASTTTRITIRFNQNVPTLRAQDVVLTGPVERGEWSGSGSTFNIAVTPKGSGIVSVTVNKSGIVPGPKTVEVWEQGKLQLISYTAVADGQADTISSTKITITFTAAVAALGAEDITIGYPTTGAGSITKGELTRVGTDNLAYDLAITVNTQGKVNVSIPEANGVDPSVYTIDVYKAVVTADLYDFTEVEIEWDADAGAENHKGYIVGDDFYDIKYSKPNSFLRITIQLTGGATGQWGDPAGTFGNLADGKINFLIPTNTAANAEAFGDVTVASIINAIGDEANRFYVNIWNSNIVKVELVETKAGTRPVKPALRTVSFDLDGGTYLNESTLDPIVVEGGKGLRSKFPSAAPRKTGHISQGWFVGETEYTAETPINGDVTLKVKWVEGEAPTFTVTFDLAGGALPGGGTTIAAIEVEEGQPTGDDFPANPRKDGQWFGGWKDSSGTVYTKDTTITGDVTLTAAWTANTQPAITRQPTMTGYKNPQQIYADGGTEVDNAAGKGNIEGYDLTLLKNAPTDSVLVLYVYNTSTDDRGGWGIGDFTGDTKYPSEGFNVSPFASHTTAFVIVKISDLLTGVGADSDHIFVNSYSAAIVQKIEIWEVDDTPVTYTEHVLTVPGQSENNLGKGNLESDDLALIMAAKAGSYLELEIQNAPTATWGLGAFTQYEKDGEGDEAPTIQLTISSTGAGTCTVTIEVVDIQLMFPEATWLAINIWGGDAENGYCGITSMKLFSLD